MKYYSGWIKSNVGTFNTQATDSYALAKQMLKELEKAVYEINNYGYKPKIYSLYIKTLKDEDFIEDDRYSFKLWS